MKTCTKCKKLKPKKAFGKDRRGRDGLNPVCKDCVNGWARRWRKDNPERVKERDRKAYMAIPLQQRKDNHARWRENNPDKVYAKRLKHRHNLTIEEFNGMLEKQNGVCAICGETERVFARLCVDHDHVTGQIRELLCSRCNSALGMLEDSSRKARAAADYLKKHLR